MLVAMRPSGTAEQLEKRRRRAIAFLRAGKPYREIARLVDASLSSVVRWAYRRDKRSGLRSRPVPGAPVVGRAAGATQSAAAPRRPDTPPSCGLSSALAA